MHLNVSKTLCEAYPVWATHRVLFSEALLWSTDIEISPLIFFYFFSASAHSQCHDGDVSCHHARGSAQFYGVFLEDEFG